MKHLYKAWFCAAGLFLGASCTDYEPLEYQVTKPESFAMQEEINAYEDLKTYINRAANPSFKLGAGLSAENYNQRGVLFRLVNRNFDEVSILNGMTHGAVVTSTGALDTTFLKRFVSAVDAEGLSVYGQPLVWHSNQNATYLNSLLAPIVTTPPPAEEGWDEVLFLDFETDDPLGYTANANAQMSFTADGEGFNGEGRALVIENVSVREAEWDSQIYVSFTQAMVPGEEYELTMNVRAEANANVGLQAQSAPGAYINWNFFPQVGFTSQWTTYSHRLVISPDNNGTKTIAFNLGNTATKYYIDNLRLTRYNDGQGSGVTAGTHLIADFESKDLGATYTMSNGGSATVVTDPQGDGKVLNIKSAQSHPQFPVTLPPGVTLRNVKSVKLDFLGTGSTGMYGQGMRASITGSSGLSNFNSPAQFGASDNVWLRGAIVLPISGLNLSEDQLGLNTFTLTVGSATGSGDYFIDNVVMDWEVTGDIIVEKTPEEKTEIITTELERWISIMVNSVGEQVDAWEVVKDPMSDSNPEEVRSSGGIEVPAGVFYWQDYLGKDYGVVAFQTARQNAKSGDLLFISDRGLANNLDKTRGLIKYIEYLEENGATVDGIATQMQLTLTTERANIDEMLTLLAATGKMVKISQLEVPLSVALSAATDEHYLEQEDLYKYVVDKYMEIVPADQRYGITIWNPTDAALGIWSGTSLRKPAYRGVARGLGAAE